jgi:hypothetical protein
MSAAAAALNALVPLPLIGPVSVPTPVPPFATGKMPDTSVVSDVLPVMSPEPLPRTGPFSVVVTPRVPEEVTGEPETLKPDGIVKPTLVTVPADSAPQVPSPLSTVVPLQVPDQSPITFDDVAAVVTYVDGLPTRIPLAGLKRLNVAASAGTANATTQPNRNPLNCERFVIRVTISRRRERRPHTEV